MCGDDVDVRTFLKTHAPEGKKSDANIDEVFDRVEFPADQRTSTVNSLSGGWKMRMSVAVSILNEPELLLLDEPTNHLDRDAVIWLTNHLLSLEGVTLGVVSHDYDFIDEVCTDITHYDNGNDLTAPCKFVYYPMTFSQFQRLKPEIAAGLPRVEKGVAVAAEVLAENAESESASSVRAACLIRQPARAPRACLTRRLSVSCGAAPVVRAVDPRDVPQPVGCRVHWLHVVQIGRQNVEGARAAARTEYADVCCEANPLDCR